MGRESSPCKPSELRRLLDGRVPEARRPELIGHLDECEPCRRALEEMAADATWWDAARRFVGADGASAPVDHPRDEAFPAESGADAGRLDEERLDFLTPSDSPGSLGRIGPYEVLEVLGRGGMGLVLRGHDPALNRPVAIKVLASGTVPGALARRRFAREARAAAAVVHEHVVAIHAVDEADGRPYLVMQYVAGRSLQERINADGPLRVEEVLRIGMQAAAGLAAAHAQGLVHRDVKPANILLENGVERVKLTDFGLARAVDDSGLTHAGVVAGTPEYMSPEQARGDPVDHRSDLFGLGSVVYAMCTGRSPFRAGSTLAVLRRICDDRPLTIRELDPQVPAWLEAVVERLHAKDPADRYQSAAEVAELLGGLLARFQEPVKQDPPSGARSLPTLGPGRARRRNRTAILLVLAASSAAGLAGLAWALIGPDRGVGAEGTGTLLEGTVPSALLPPSGRTGPLSPFGPPRTIAGVVRDRDTGEPVPGVRLTLASLPVMATSDSAGHYELRGPANSLPAGKDVTGRFDLLVDPAAPPYLAMSVEAGGGDNFDPIRADIGLVRGIPFRLRLTDKATGQPIRGAKVVYRPLHPNPFVDRTLPPGASGFHSRATEGLDGVYRGVVLPGPGAIGVENYAEHYGPVSVDPVAFFVPGGSAAAWVDASTVYGTRQLLAVEIGGGHGVHLLPQDGMSGVLLMNPQPGPGPVELDLTLRNNRARGNAR